MDTINVWVVLGLLVTHYISDFLLQDDWMATQKSEDVQILCLHAFIYSGLFCTLAACVWRVLIPGFLYGGLNGLLHLAVDYHTSRWNKRLWQAGERHWFFCMIGLDQLLHIIMLLLTWQLFTRSGYGRHNQLVTPYQDGGLDICVRSVDLGFGSGRVW
jgi:hypothetical protein